MGLFAFLRRRDERAIPEPGSLEFDAAVQGSAIPDSQSVSMGQPGWTNPSAADQALRQLGIDPSDAQVESSSRTIELRGADAREKIVETLRAHGIDPDKKGQTIDASSVPGLQQSIFSILGQVMRMPASAAGSRRRSRIRSRSSSSSPASGVPARSPRRSSRPRRSRSSASSPRYSIGAGRGGKILGIRAS